MTKAQYLLMCEQMGTEPLAEEIPADYEDFPYAVQLAMNIYSILPDRWEGMSGTYMGKDLNIFPYLCKVYAVDWETQILQFVLLIDRIISEIRSKAQKQKAAKAKRQKT